MPLSPKLSSASLLRVWRNVGVSLRMWPAFDKHHSLESAVEALEDPGLEIGEPCRQRCQLVAAEIQDRQSSEQTKIIRQRYQLVIFEEQRLFSNFACSL